MIQIGIDTSVLIGLFDPKDKWHEAAVRIKQSLKQRQSTVAVFDCVLAETLSTIARRMQEQRRPHEFNQAVTQISSEHPKEGIVWMLPDVPTLYTEILSLVQSSRGELNFNDALIALSCRNRAIPYLASFDQDFDQFPWLKRIGSAEDLDALPAE